MSNEHTDGNESIEPRTERALAECMTVLPDGRDVYTVVGENGGTYRVDAREERCTCPDHEHRSARCKHLRRVAFATGARSVPASVDTVDDHLGQHTDTGAVVVASDGGVIDAGDEGEILDASEERESGGRPADCDCGAWNHGTGLPCWPCHRDGFDEPASVDEE